VSGLNGGRAPEFSQTSLSNLPKIKPRFLRVGKTFLSALVTGRAGLFFYVNTKRKLARIILGAFVGAVLWAGCATPPRSGLKRVASPAPADLTKQRPDTHPELRVGWNDLQNPQTETEMPRRVVIWKAPANNRQF